MAGTRDVGNMGEAAFESMCADAGLISNRSSRDRSGWDYLVEFPIEPALDIAIDEREYPIECRIQVKSSDSHPKRSQIKLSNLERFAKAPMPAFVLFLEFDGERNPVNGFLVHINKKLIARVLKRLREVNSTDFRSEIQRVKLWVTYSDADKLQEVDGRSLVQAIQDTVQEGMEVYVKNKFDILRTVGYEDSHGEFKFSVVGDEGVHALVDNMLGYSDSVAIEEAMLIGKRFGLDSIRGRPEASNGTINIQIKSGTKGRVEIRPEHFGQPLFIPCEVFVAPFRSIGMEKFKAIRVKTDLFDWRISPHSGESRLTYTIGGDRTIANWERSLKFMSALAGNGDHHEIRLICEGHPEPVFPKPDDSDQKSFFGELAIYAKAARILANEYNFDSNTTNCSLEDLENNAQSIEFLVYVAQPGSISNISLSFKPDEEPDDVCTLLLTRLNMPLTVLFHRSVNFIDVHAGALFTLSGTVTEKNGIYRLSDCVMELQRKIVITNSTKNPTDTFLLLRTEIVDKLEQRGLVVLNRAKILLEGNEI